MGTRSSVTDWRMQYLIALAIIAPYVYDRYVAFSAILANRPGSLQNLNRFKSHEVKFRDQLRNCEDVLLEEAMGIAFLSCNPGRDQWNTVMVRPLRISTYRISTGPGLLRLVRADT
jgi:hypothetical protein